MNRRLIILLCSALVYHTFCFSHDRDTVSDTTAVQTVPALAVPAPGEVVLAKNEPVRLQRVQLLIPSLHNKAKPVYVGAGVFLGGAILDYAVVRPLSRSVEEDNMNDQFALVNPSILASLMKVIGPLMVCQQTSKAAAAYKTFTLSAASYNYAWWFFGAGVGLSFLGQIVNVSATLKNDKDLRRAASIMGITGDVVYASTGVYAYYYFKNLQQRAQEKITPQPVSVIPFSDNGQHGCVLQVLF